jgi:glyceraldehyde-3-phosphate dehydrogenase (NAD(P))
MSYYFAETLSAPFDDVVSRTLTALQGQGFGVITEIDVKETLKKKLGEHAGKRRANMAGQQDKIQVAVNGYGVIGKRVADAVASQDDMALVGVADIEADWRMRVAERKGFAVFASLEDRAGAMREAGIKVAGHLDDLLGQAEVVVDCTPKRVAAKNVEAYRRRGIKFIVQGGEKHEVTGHSFVADANYAEAVGRESTRVVSCNTTSVVRTSPC